MKISEEILEFGKEEYLKGSCIREVVNKIHDELGIEISTEMLRRKLKKLKIIRDNSLSQKFAKRKHLPIDEILELYNNKLISARKIAKIFNSNKRTIRKILEENDIKIRNEHERINLTNSKHPKMYFNGNSNERAYIIGLVKGAITPIAKSKYTIRLTVSTTVNSFIQLMKTTFEKYGYVRIYSCKNRPNETKIAIDLDFKSFGFLINIKENNLFIETFKEKEFFNFVSGFIDSDGSVILRKAGDYFQYVIRIYNEDLSLLKIIKEKLESYGYRPTIYINGRKGETRHYNNKELFYNNDYYILEISNKKDCIRMLNNLNIKQKEKVGKKDLILRIENEGIIYYKDTKKY